MKKLLVATMAMSLILSPLAQAEQSQDKTVGQKLDRMIEQANQFGTIESEAAAYAMDHVRETLVINPAFESELQLRRAQMEAYRAARRIVSDNQDTRFVVSMAGIAVAGLGTFAVAEGISRIKVVSKFGKFGRLTAFLATIAGGYFIAKKTHSVLILTEGQLNDHMDALRTRIAQLELAQ